MPKLKESLCSMSGYLQSLNTPMFASKIEDAVKKRDKTAIVNICREAKIPRRDWATVVSMLLSMCGQPKYPDFM